MHVFKLRQLIETDPAHPVYLQTVRGRGYRLVREYVSDLPATPKSKKGRAARPTKKTKAIGRR